MTVCSPIRQAQGGQRAAAVGQDQPETRVTLEDAGVDPVGDVARGVEGELDDRARVANVLLIGTNLLVGPLHDVGNKERIESPRKFIGILTRTFGIQHDSYALPMQRLCAVTHRHLQIFLWHTQERSNARKHVLILNSSDLLTALMAVASALVGRRRRCLRSLEL